MPHNRILISGGGIAGLSLALTLHQIGVPCVVFESVENLRPLGVGINLQPNAVRELFDLGLDEDMLDSVGIQTREWAVVGLNGNEIYSEPRGRLAGYNWPQYSVHRGKLQMLLYRLVIERLGPEAVMTGHRVIGYQNTDTGVVAQVQTPSGAIKSIQGLLLIGADGLHSAVRAQMHPDQPPVHWGGAVMWRGTSMAKAVRSGASFVGLGTDKQRMIIYPISQPDPETGLSEINWIAEVTVDPQSGPSGDWNKRVDLSDFAHHFADWTYDWMDVPALLAGASTIYEYPMIDRDPVPTWVDGNTVLIGDAAHIMYPTGSNGAGQAIVDGRVLGACLLEHGVGAAALRAFDDKLRVPVSDLVLRNRGAGPFGILSIVDERCGGVFDDIHDVIPEEEISEFMANYKAAAGFAIDTLNSAPSTIPDGAHIRA